MPQGPSWKKLTVLMTSKRFAEAEALCAEALAINEHAVQWQLGLAWARVGLGKIHDALSLALRIAREHPRNENAYRLIVEIWLRLGRPELGAEWVRTCRRNTAGKTAEELRERVDAVLARNALGSSTAVDVEGTEDEVPLTSIAKRPEAAIATAQIRVREAPVEPPPRRVPENVEEQLGLLFGEELFGLWSAPASGLAPSAGVHYSRLVAQRRRAKLALVVFLSLAAAPLFVAARLGIERRASSAIESNIDELHHLLETGSLEQAAPLVRRLLSLIESAGEHVSASQREAVLRAEATLYRYFDADPARRERVTRGLRPAAPDDSFDAVVARAMILPIAERKPLLPELERIARARAEDPAAIALIGGIHGAAGDLPAALRSYRMAEAIQPVHVAHLAELAVAELRGGQTSRAETIVETMMDVAPRSGWTSLAREASQRAAGEEEPSSPPKKELIPPVARAEIFVSRAIAALAHHDDETAKAQLVSAIEIVHHERPFIRDWLDRLHASAGTKGTDLIVDATRQAEDTDGAGP